MLLILAAVGAVLAAAKVTKHRRRAGELRRQALGDAEQIVDASTREARDALRRAGEHQRLAKAAEATAKARLDRLAAGDESLAEMVDAWNKPSD